MVALSSTKAQYKSLLDGAKEISWFWTLLKELQPLRDKSTWLHCDSQNNIKLLNNPFYAWTKHIEI
jgi:hypothetical protein